MMMAHLEVKLTIVQEFKSEEVAKSNYISSHLFGTNDFFFIFRHFQPIYFWMTSMVLILVGAIFSTESEDPTFMNRDQTDEWKGILGQKLTL